LGKRWNLGVTRSESERGRGEICAFYGERKKGRNGKKEGINHSGARKRRELI